MSRPLPEAFAQRFAIAARPVATAAALLVLFALCVGLGLPSLAAAESASSTDSAWLALPAERTEALSDPRERRGQEVFDQRCAACHGEVPDSSFGPAFLPPMPGTQALRRRYGEALPALLEERTDLSAEYIEAVVRDGLGSMPFFRPTELSRDDLEALVAYLTRPLVQE